MVGRRNGDRRSGVLHPVLLEDIRRARRRVDRARGADQLLGARVSRPAVEARTDLRVRKEHSVPRTRLSREVGRRARTADGRWRGGRRQPGGRTHVAP
eukprot:6536679-Prymnesium_polylepis.1